MAWLERDPSGFYHVAFRFGNRKFKRSLRTKHKRSAEAACLRLDENIHLAHRGRLEIPTSVDIAAFLLSDGKLNGKPTATKSVLLTQLFEEYLSSLPTDSLEPETIRVSRIHMRHLEKGRETFRHVPMSADLRHVLSKWFNHSPASAYAFPAEHHVARVRNRNRRENDCESVSPDEATDHLEQTLRGTRWERIRGWHIFRHSFISNCASLSVDQRMIDAWVGHQTDEMRRRYRHLFPNRQTLELEKVFG